jgi:multicomponent Na+:H+ antiporter subunit D
VVKAGVFTVVKLVVYLFGVDFLRQSGQADWLTWVAGFSIVVASIVALQADNLKRRLAFSTVSQLSYVTLATALLSTWSIKAAALHIAAHAVGKITLFFAAGAIYTAAHKTRVSELNGIGRRMPWTMGAFGLAALSMIGLPPTFGFISKWYLVSGAMATANTFALVVIALSTLLNAAYFLPIVYQAFFKPLSPEDEHHPHGEAPWPMVLALSVTAGLTVALFFFPDGALALASRLA